jgi:hypothetical protein
MNRLDKLVVKWQSRLRLHQWDIMVRYVKFDDPDKTGDCEAFPTVRDASIRVKRGMSKLDEERTIIHELLHVMFHAAKGNHRSVAGRENEVSIEVMAKILQMDVRWKT